MKNTKYGCDCYFCGEKFPAVDRAIDEGWEPGFFDTDGEEVSWPVCPECVPEHLAESGGELVRFSK